MCERAILCTMAHIDDGACVCARKFWNHFPTTCARLSLWWWLWFIYSYAHTHTHMCVHMHWPECGARERGVNERLVASLNGASPSPSLEPFHIYVCVHGGLHDCIALSALLAMLARVCVRPAYSYVIQFWLMYARILHLIQRSVCVCVCVHRRPQPTRQH